MNILLLTTELRIAGAERVIAALATGLRRRGHVVLVVSLAPPPADPSRGVAPELEAAGVGVASLELTKATPWRLARLRRLVAHFAPEVVHSHLFHANLAARLFARPPGVPLVNTVHIAERRRRARWHFWLDRLTLGRCTVQTAVSLAVRDFHAPRVGLAPAAMPVVYNGIQVPQPCSPPRICELRNGWGVGAATRVIGSVGRLDHQKGYDLLLKSLPALARHVPSGERWALVILGEGPERQRLEGLAAPAPANLQVVLPGFRADAADCIGAFDLFVMPSRYEGFGLTLAEAMAHGIPALAANVDSLPELLAGYPAGRLAEFANAPSAAVADAIATALRLSPCPPCHRFAIDTMVGGYLELYRQIVFV